MTMEDSPSLQLRRKAESIENISMSNDILKSDVCSDDANSDNDRSSTFSEAVNQRQHEQAPFKRSQALRISRDNTVTSTLRNFTMLKDVSSDNTLSYDSFSSDSDGRNPRFKFAEPNSRNLKQRQSFNKRLKDLNERGLSVYSSFRARAQTSYITSSSTSSLARHPDSNTLYKRKKVLSHLLPEFTLSSTQSLPASGSDDSNEAPSIPCSTGNTAPRSLQHSLKTGFGRFKHLSIPNNLQKLSSTNRLSRFLSVSLKEKLVKCIKISGIYMDGRCISDKQWTKLSRLSMRDLKEELKYQDFVFEKCPRLITSNDVIYGAWDNLDSLGLFLAPYKCFITDNRFSIQLDFEEQSYRLYDLDYEDEAKVLAHCDVEMIRDLTYLIRQEDFLLPKLTVCCHEECACSALAYSVCQGL